jgi:hypothetical protein
VARPPQHVDVQVDAPPVAGRDAEAGREELDHQVGPDRQRVEQGVRAGVAAAALVVDAEQEGALERRPVPGQPCGEAQQARLVRLVLGDPLPEEARLVDAGRGLDPPGPRVGHEVVVLGRGVCHEREGRSAAGTEADGELVARQVEDVGAAQLHEPRPQVLLDVADEERVVGLDQRVRAERHRGRDARQVHRGLQQDVGHGRAPVVAPESFGRTSSPNVSMSSIGSV